MLEIWKYRTIEAADGSEAVKIAENAQPDLILMDVKLPVLDGFSVAQQIRQTPQIENMPIIFLSGYAETAYKQKADAAGGNEYLVKPVDFGEIGINRRKISPGCQ